MTTARERYDLVLAGTGFASSFFLMEYLRHASAGARVLVLERGDRHDHDWQVRNRLTSPILAESTISRTGLPEKTWSFTVGFGGSSACWWACAPRMLPADFELASRYGVGRDWPVSYADLEPYYETVEAAMAISGPDDGSPYPRRAPYPQPPHRFSAPDRIMKRAYPDQFFQQPTARARVASATRSQCCASGVCHICPVDAKFTIANGLAHLYADPRVELRLGAEVTAVDMEGGHAAGLRYVAGEHEAVARGDLVGLGANAIFNAAILLRSGLDHPLIGRRIHEQIGLEALVYLDGLDAFQGSTVITAHGYMLYDGPHRRDRAGALIEFWNKPILRTEPGRWRQLIKVKLLLEDMPSEDNRVMLPPDPGDGRPVVHFGQHSAYVERGMAWAKERLPGVLAPLPVERIEFARQPLTTEEHILGTAVMGDDPATSVVDAGLVCHGVRNLLVLGSSCFPTGAPANPTLTLSALAVRAAHRLMASGQS